MLHLLIRRGVAPLARMLWRPDVRGTENVPSDGPVIFASNHRSAIDTAVIPFVAPRPVAFLGKAEYFQGASPKDRLRAAFLSALGYVPVERGNAAAGLAALGAAQKVLDSGGAFGIYPEGTRSLDGKLHRGHTGVAALALATRAPVVPVALSGTEGLLPVGKKIPRLANVTVRFGEPLDFSRYDGLAASPPIRRAVTDEVMYAILELSGQEYVDAYHKRPEGDAA
ncbi:MULTISPECIES: lysophospholipid acyltransferase family protein [Prauserella salsuginis group]|uniref:1-acyl-sn-glycerol-3-phosphate acyltransferase n=2 Tax=Prauserella salsuginis group TaxID=2893672 RepID=A0A839XMA5_9PSEU|nr:MULTISPECIES: lysophospholipid acyltransferase family protein [Prauserella salsuginis group]MBB3661873.1 1-acyl-sn-glycerol-3-phosphate acyltransferase [Prauserella sediminis]MCR3722751.1 1-acyl-sn-glycerol-3-phosphate acyltransferase [Prauserella flava]MCR3737194.1 1-acyl-sn-glycerol-3-phosphate acyltransferase [Prauserella salsuginis]